MRNRCNHAVSWGASRMGDGACQREQHLSGILVHSTAQGPENPPTGRTGWCRVTLYIMLQLKLSISVVSKHRRQRQWRHDTLHGTGLSGTQ